MTDSRSTEEWVTTSNGTYRAAGVGGGITGKGAHLLLIDDVVKDFQTATSETQLESHVEWYDSTAYTRLAPGGGVILIMTRWSHVDLAGRLINRMRPPEEESGASSSRDTLLGEGVAATPEERAKLQAAGSSTDQDRAAVEALIEGDAWDIVRFPAIAEQYEYIDYKHDPVGDTQEWELITSSEPLDESSLDPSGYGLTLFREPGGALHPERYDIKALRRIKNTLAPRIWEALYQQNPTPADGDFFKEEWFKNFREVPGEAFTDSCPGIWINAWDLAIGESRQNDWTVGVRVYMQHEEGELPSFYVYSADRFRGNTSVIAQRIVRMSIFHRKTRVGIEDGHIYKAMLPTLKMEMSSKQASFTPEPQAVPTDKVTRATPLQGAMGMGVVYFNRAAEDTWLKVLINEAMTFPNGLNDDFIDALAHAINMGLAISSSVRRVGTSGIAGARSGGRLSGRGMDMTLKQRLGALKGAGSTTWMSA
jgi:predicted phage terminase large subunit-like protein